MTVNKYLFNLKELIDALTKSEKELAKKHLLAYQSNHTKNSKKMFLVFKEISSLNTFEYDSIKKIISPKSTISSFNRLIIRTNERVLESLIIDVNIFRKDLYNEIFRKKYSLRKQLMQAHILNRKGLIIISLNKYDKIIKSATLYELYDEVIEALLEKLTIASGGRGGLSTRKIKKQIDEFENIRIELREIKYLIQDYSASSVVNSDNVSLKTTLEKCIRKVRKRNSKIKSYNARSILMLFKLEYCSLINEPLIFINNGLNLKDLILKNPAIYSERRLIYINNELAKADILRLKFISALQFSIDSIDLLKEKKNNVFLAIIDLKARIFFWINDLVNSQAVLDQVLILPIANKYPIRKTKFLYYKAVLYFQLNEFKESYRSLNDLKEIEKDKEGWNIWIRIMRILCSIELLRLNLVDYDIESFRKYIQRITKEGNMNSRVEMILKILVELDRENFNFKEVAIKRKIELANLKKTTGKYKWDIQSPEMILFHDWFDAKLHSRTYDPNLEPYREQVQKDEAKPLSKAKEKKYRSLGLIE